MVRVTLNVKEVSEMLGISTAKIYEMVRMHQIPNIRVGSRIIFHEDVLRDWMGASNIAPRGPLFTPLPTKVKQESGGQGASTYTLQLTAETIRFIQTVLEIQEADLKKHLDEVFDVSAIKSPYYQERPEDLERRKMYAQRRYHAFIVALDELNQAYNQAQAQ
ncbi:helix-turn-helix domain-containing protein [Paenibacillus sp. NPDC056579]|uniref:helix-turn-helix domain-containing protein n=1 Tax=Paenibacillus sp. NPDC056579 TaxID=3345871 RepID=UPI0036CDCC0A